MKSAHSWYAQQSVQAADGFFEEILPILDRIEALPRLYPSYLYGTQRAVLSTCPLSVIYRELLHEIQIIAVAHAKRRPGYWAGRL